MIGGYSGNPLESDWKKAPDDAGALVARDTRKKSVSRDDWRSHIEQVIQADFEDVLIGTHILSNRSGRRSRAGCCKADVLGIEAQIVVFKLRSPIVGEGIFQPEADKETVQVALP